MRFNQCPTVLFALLFFGCLLKAEQAPPIQVESLLKTTTAWDGVPLPAYPEGQPEISILKITIAPGASLPWHKHPVINSGVLLSGELEVTHEDGRVLHLRPWDAISEVVDTWHYGKNPGAEPAVILVVYSGAVDLPLTILKDEVGDKDKAASAQGHSPAACCAE
jgi:quercetin dioxygenase-like cupin family protein